MRDSKTFRGFLTLARNSPWLLIAAGLHVILGAVLSLMYIQHERQKAAVVSTEIGVGSAKAAEPEPVELPEPPDRKQIPRNEEPSELVSHEEEPVFVPTEDEVPEDLYADLGDPTGADEPGDDSTGGTSYGVGTQGHYGNGVPATWASRRKGNNSRPPGGRAPRGGTQGTEKAVLEGLRWLVRHQNTDGSWGADTLTEHCNPDSPCLPPGVRQDASYNTGMTALALLAFLGQGIAPGDKVEIVDTARGKRHDGGEVVKRGIRWLMKRQRENGSWDEGAFESPENHTLATMALCEAYGLSGNREVKRAAQAALDFLVAAQKENEGGERWGWGVGSRAELAERHARGELDDEAFQLAQADLNPSITCWVVMALRSARDCDLGVADGVLEGALAYGRELTSLADLASASATADAPDEHGTFDDHPARNAAIGILIRAFVDRDLGDPYLEPAAREIVADLPVVSKDRRSVDFYYWYFATLALNQLDGPDSPRKGAGKYWEPWNRALIEALLELQDKSREHEVCARGGWLAAARGNARGLALYNTAMNVLTLEVYYRLENVFR
jgi:squalene-hopene cyclase-like protein